MTEKSAKPKQKTKSVNTFSTKSLTQVIGWSVHCPENGRLGPLFSDSRGMTYYLDTVTALGFQPVSDKDDIFLD
jgi:hypothetical protein